MDVDVDNSGEGAVVHDCQYPLFMHPSPIIAILLLLPSPSPPPSPPPSPFPSLPHQHTLIRNDRYTFEHMVAMLEHDRLMKSQRAAQGHSNTVRRVKQYSIVHRAAPSNEHDLINIHVFILASLFIFFIYKSLLLIFLFFSFLFLT